MHINVNVCVCASVCVYIWQPCTLYAGLKDLQTSPKAKQNDCDSLQPAVYPPLPPALLLTLPFPLEQPHHIRPVSVPSTCVSVGAVADCIRSWQPDDRDDGDRDDVDSGD